MVPANTSPSQLRRVLAEVTISVPPILLADHSPLYLDLLATAAGRLDGGLPCHDPQDAEDDITP